VVLIRLPGSTWHEPATSAYANERELQDLVKRSPSLLPGGEPLAVADEFWVPGVGSVDLVGVSSAGEVTLVECKLKANPEIRREVIGQVLAYAGGLWRMAYDDFATTFAARAGRALVEAVADATGQEVDEAALRANISRRLMDGEFELVIAVDAITPELRLIIEYLNEHTVPSVHVLALELAYGRDAEVELLIPTVYGQESADRKTQASGGAKWTPGSFAEQVQARTSGATRRFIERLLEHGSQKGHHPFYGSGATPGMSYYYDVAGQPTSVWALYLYESDPRVALSLGAIHARSPELAVALLRRLKADPQLASALGSVDESSLNKYPQLRIDTLLVHDATESTFFAGIDELIRPAG
jgi:hypothetical protein